MTDRVAEGGHFADRATIEANFAGNLEMLNLNFRFIDHLTIMDTSEFHHVMVATLNAGQVVSSISFNELPKWFTTYMPAIASLIR